MGWNVHAGHGSDWVPRGLRTTVCPHAQCLSSPAEALAPPCVSHFLVQRVLPAPACFLRMLALSAPHLPHYVSQSHCHCHCQAQQHCLVHYPVGPFVLALVCGLRSLTMRRHCHGLSCCSPLGLPLRSPPTMVLDHESFLAPLAVGETLLPTIP